jgi:hypothetical protein
MRKLILPICLISLIIPSLMSCEELFPAYRKIIRIKNDSKFDIKISSKKYIQTINIEKGKFVEGVASRFSPPLYFVNREIDSLVIEFKDGKVLIQYCNGKPLLVSDEKSDSCKIVNNLMNIGNSKFEKVSSRKTIGIYTYTISNQDYERAVFIKK